MYLTLSSQVVQVFLVWVSIFLCFVCIYSTSHSMSPTHTRNFSIQRRSGPPQHLSIDTAAIFSQQLIPLIHIAGLTCSALKSENLFSLQLEILL